MRPGLGTGARDSGCRGDMVPDADVLNPVFPRSMGQPFILASGKGAFAAGDDGG
jgi:hypothetical protein